MTARQRTCAVLSLLLAALFDSTLAFTSPSVKISSIPRTTTKHTTGTRLQVLPDIHGAVDFSSLPDALAQAQTLLADAADVAVDAGQKELGWWGQYLNIFKNILDFVHTTIDEPLRNAGVTQTWGVAIALFTCCMRALLIPLSIQQNKSSEYMKALKPYMNEIKQKFKDNENARNQALGKLMEDAEQNPLAGCLVSIAQLPILLGLYRGIRLLAQEGRLDEPFLWIPSLEGPVTAPDYRGTEWLTDGWTTDAASGFPVPGMGWETTLAFLAMPIILVVLQSFTLNTLQPPPDENATEEEKETLEKTQGFLKFLPLMIGFFSLQVPAGLTIYWVTTNLFTLTQSLTVRAYFAANPPEIKLPEYWDSLSADKDISEMTPEEKRQAAQAGLSVGPTMADLLDEAKFYAFIERRPLRSDSAAWERASEKKVAVPPELDAWVKAALTDHKPSESKASKEVAEAPATA